MAQVSIVSTLYCPRHPHVVPVVPTSSPSSPHLLEGPHIIANPPEPTPPTRIPQKTPNPPPPPADGGPQISKNAIRFELIKIF